MKNITNIKQTLEITSRVIRRNCTSIETRLKFNKRALIRSENDALRKLQGADVGGARFSTNTQNNKATSGKKDHLHS